MRPLSPHRPPSRPRPRTKGKGIEDEDKKEEENENREDQPATGNHPGARILLLGLGNDILSDDAIGLWVAAEIRERFAGQEKITVLESTEMGLALLDLIVGFDTLVIVDAVQTEKAPVGFVHEIDAAELRALPTVSPHFLGIAEMLALGSKLGLSMPRRVSLFAVEVGDPLTVGTVLTPALQNAFHRIVDHIAQALAHKAAA